MGANGGSSVPSIVNKKIHGPIANVVHMITNMKGHVPTKTNMNLGPSPLTRALDGCSHKPTKHARRSSGFEAGSCRKCRLYMMEAATLEKMKMDMAIRRAVRVCRALRPHERAAMITQHMVPLTTYSPGLDERVTADRMTHAKPKPTIDKCKDLDRSYCHSSNVLALSISGQRPAPPSGCRRTQEKMSVRPAGYKKRPSHFL